MIRPENRLLLLFANPYLDAGQKEEALRLLTKPLRSRLFLRQAKKEGLAALVYHHIKKLDLLSFLSIDIQEELRQIYYYYAARNDFLINKIRPVFESFGREGLPLMVLKGVALCYDLYPNIALRPVTDLDVLIRQPDRENADELLRRLGYRLVFESSKRLFTSHRGLNSCVYADAGESFSLHLHWHLVNASWPVDKVVDAIDMARIWQEARPMFLDDFEVLILAPHHLLLYLAWHAFLHGMERLILFSDIAGLVDKYALSMDKDRLRQEAEVFGLSFIAAEVLAMAQRLLGKDFSYFFEGNQGRAGTFFQRILSVFFKKNLRSCFLSYFILLSRQPTAAEKLRFLYKTKQGRFFWRWLS